MNFTNVNDNKIEHLNVKSVKIVKSFFLTSITFLLITLIFSGIALLKNGLKLNDMNHVVLSSLNATSLTFNLNASFYLLITIFIIGAITYFISIATYTKSKFKLGKIKSLAYIISTLLFIFSFGFFIVAIGLTPKNGTSNVNDSIFFANSNFVYFDVKNNTNVVALYNLDGSGWIYSFFLGIFVCILFGLLASCGFLCIQIFKPVSKVDDFLSKVNHEDDYIKHFSHKLFKDEDNNNEIEQKKENKQKTDYNMMFKQEDLNKKENNFIIDVDKYNRYENDLKKIKDKRKEYEVETSDIQKEKNQKDFEKLSQKYLYNQDKKEKTIGNFHQEPKRKNLLLQNIDLRKEYELAVRKDEALTSKLTQNNVNVQLPKTEKIPLSKNSDNLPTIRLKKDVELEKITSEKLNKVADMSVKKIKETRLPLIQKVDLPPEQIKQLFPNQQPENVVVVETEARVKKDKKKETFIDKEIKERLKKFYE